MVQSRMVKCMDIRICLQPFIITTLSGTICFKFDTPELLSFIVAFYPSFLLSFFLSPVLLLSWPWPQPPAGLLRSDFMALAWTDRLFSFLISCFSLTDQPNTDLEKTPRSFFGLYTRNKLPLFQRYLDIFPPAGPSPEHINSFMSL